MNFQTVASQCAIVIAFWLLIADLPAFAEEFFGYGGMMRGVDEDTKGSSYSWQLEYRTELFDPLAISLSYLNEGHVPNHHRDGASLQIWGQTDALERRLSLSAGIGPYHYYDTTVPSVSNGSHTNDHGVGGMLSLAATWRDKSPWLFQVRSNWVKTFGSTDSVSALFGIGYQLDSPLPSKAPLPPQKPENQRSNNEITFLMGQTITNSFESEKSVALSLEYRRRFLSYLNWTIAWLNEGDTRLIRRHGLASQFWVVKSFLDDSIAFGVGSGAYLAVDQRGGNDNDGDRYVSAIGSLTGSWRFTTRWCLRTTWNRIQTNYDRDTDVILAGIGYRF